MLALLISYFHCSSLWNEFARSNQHNCDTDIPKLPICPWNKCVLSLAFISWRVPIDWDTLCLFQIKGIGKMRQRKSGNFRVCCELNFGNKIKLFLTQIFPEQRIFRWRFWGDTDHKWRVQGWVPYTCRSCKYRNLELWKENDLMENLIFQAGRSSRVTLKYCGSLPEHNYYR